MTLLLDEHHSRLAELLRERGHTVHLVTDVLSAGAKDPAVAAWADQNRAIVVTSDSGFKRLITRVPARDRGRFRHAGLLVLHGEYDSASRRLRELIDVIEFMYIRVQATDDRRLVAEIRDYTFWVEQ